MLVCIEVKKGLVRFLLILYLWVVCVNVCRIRLLL